jgi:hypothetical protein
MAVNCPSCNGQIKIPQGTDQPPAPKPSIPTIRHTPQHAGRATGYIDQYLMPGGNVVYRTRLHCAVFLPPLTLFIFAICLFLTVNSGAVTLGGLLLVFVVFSSGYNRAHWMGHFGICCDQQTCSDRDRMATSALTGNTVEQSRSRRC